MQNQATPLSKLGKYGLIEQLTKSINTNNKNTIKGIGDDASIIRIGKNDMLISTDTLIEGVNFDLVYTPLKHLGYKAVVAGISDIIAMNALPTHILVSLSVSGKFSAEAIDLLYSGINKACKNYDVDIVGGDVTSSVTGLFITITSIGTADKGEPVMRSTASVGDMVCLSGDVGSAYAGLQILKREKEVFSVNPNSQPDLTNYNYVLERQLKPEVRKNIIAELQNNQIVPTAMIDVSNGLSSEIIHLCKASGVGVELYEKDLPIAQETANVANELNMEPTLFAMNGGEDYELLFTIKSQDFDKIKKIQGISVIGKILQKNAEMKLIGRGEGAVTISSQGWGN